MKALLTAIAAKWDATAALPAYFTGGLRAIEAPGGAGMPYVVWEVMDAPHTVRFGGNAYSEVTMQFAGYGTDGETLVEKMELLATTFDAGFTPATGNLNNVVRESDVIPVSPMKPNDESGVTVYAAYVIYRFSFSD